MHEYYTTSHNCLVNKFVANGPVLDQVCTRDVVLLNHLVLVFLREFRLKAGPYGQDVGNAVLLEGHLVSSGL